MPSNGRWDLIRRLKVKVDNILIFFQEFAILTLFAIYTVFINNDVRYSPT